MSTGSAVMTKAASPKWLPFRAAVAAARGEARHVLLEHEAYALLAAGGIPTPAHVFLPADRSPAPDLLKSLDSAELVLKVVSPDIVHKSDVGGVRSVTRDPAAVERGIRELRAEVRKRAPGADLRGILVAERVAGVDERPGIEYLASVRRDPAFGPVILFALGGRLAEWYGRAAAGASRVLFAAEGFDPEAALAAIADTPLGELALAPSRIHPRAPVQGADLARILSGLARISAALGGDAGEGDDAGGWALEELEINPFAATSAGLIALDAFARIGPPAAAPRPARPWPLIQHLLHPRSAAVYGASAKGDNAGRIILRNLKQSPGLDYGHLYAVHPTAGAIEGVRCYRDSAALPEAVDLAVIAVPAAAAGAAIHELVRECKARSIILISGGFAETGDDRLASAIQTEIQAAPERAERGPVMVGGNCLGIVSKGEYNTFFLPAYKLPFHDAPGDSLVAVSQSGAYLVTLTSNLDGVVFPRASISYGNEMDLTAADFLAYYLDYEPEVSTFAFYIEGFPPGEGRRFLQLVRRAAAAGKAVVVYKAGKTATGARAAQSHTASLTGNYAVASALLRAAGALVTETLNMFEDYVKVFTMLDGRRMSGRCVGVITNAGFEAGAVADHLYGLELATFTPETLAALRACLPAIAHAANPVDTTPMADTAHFIQGVEILAQDPAVDALIVSAIPATATLDVLTPNLAGEHAENLFAMGSLPAELRRVAAATRKPLVVTIDSGGLYDPSVHWLERAGIPVFRKIDRASRALSAFAGFHVP
jgi:acyl-CoA synthetase (NDP forming)